MLRRHGLEGLAVENQKACAQHIISSLHPIKLCFRLKPDLPSSKHELGKDILEFFKHAQILSNAFHHVNADGLNEPVSSFDSGKDSDKWPDESDAQRKGQKPKTISDEAICLWAPHREPGFLHRLKNSQSRPKDVKKLPLNEMAMESLKNGPRNHTGSQTKLELPTKPSPPKAGCLRKSIYNSKSSSFMVFLRWYYKLWLFRPLRKEQG